METEKLSEQEQRERRQANARRRREMKRRRRRKVLILRGLIAAACVLVICLACRGISSAVNGTGDNTGKNTGDDPSVTYTDVPATGALHLSFPTLLADESTASGNNSTLTVDEFNEILEDLYQKGYVLADIYDLAQDDGNGGLRVGRFRIPEGKKPLILSQRDVSYPLDQAGAGYASRLVVDDSGNLASEYEQDDGTVVTGNYDVVPCVEAFIREHPDFSCRGARGVLGLTGYNGILGYRTSPDLSKSAAEGNPYADTYGTFDTAREKEECQTVVQALKYAGWRFASYGYDYVSYGSELSMVQADAGRWESEVEPLVGDTDILIYPWRTDLGSWSDYGTDNEKYQYLRSLGFRYFCIADNDAGFLQVGKDYVHEAVREIGSMQEYEQLW